MDESVAAAPHKHAGSSLKVAARCCAAVLSVCLFGCSVFQPARQDVTVTTTKPGATVKANGAIVGKSPVTFSARRNRDLYLIATKPGYQDSVMQIPRQTSGTFMWDMVGGVLFLIPFVGLLTPGAYELSATQVDMPMNASR